MKKTEFAKSIGISGSTLAKISRNELVSMEVLIRIFNNNALDDVGGDVIRYSVNPTPDMKRRKSGLLFSAKRDSKYSRLRKTGEGN